MSDAETRAMDAFIAEHALDEQPPPPRTIVAVITKTWKGQEIAAHVDYIGEHFEEEIRVNEERGYVLRSWRFTKTAVKPILGGEQLVETIIAVFEIPAQTIVVHEGSLSGSILAPMATAPAQNRYGRDKGSSELEREDESAQERGGTLGDGTSSD